ncbi:PaaI family thioesterase [Nocardioides dubius]|uniref:Acyl-coenzyme A thioesterase THEM4 n=1 Tax=Nocardioides dubius TaxID=317019 RepID=A0ABN1TVW7_9ACTN
MRAVEEETDHRAATLELIEATRELMLASATTEMGLAELHSATEQMRAITAVLAQRRRPRVLRGDFDAPARARAIGPEAGYRLFPFHPVAFPMEMHFSESGARASVVANALFEGPRETVHGGFVAHILDCMLGTLMQARGTLALTASLEITYHRRTPLDEPLELFSRIVEIDGRKTIAEGWIEHDGVRTAEARGLFIALKETR